MRSPLSKTILFLAFAGSASAQQLVNCAPATPCTTTGPSLTGTGDAAWMAFGKVNADLSFLYPAVATNTSAISALQSSVTNASNLTSGTVSASLLPNIPVTNLNSGTGASSTTFWRGDATWATPTASAAFNSVTGGTNTTAAMVVGTGSSLAATGTGSIAASKVNSPTQTLQLGASSGSPLAFGSTNSVWYGNGAAGGLTLSGFATNPGNDVMISPFEIYVAADTVDTSFTAGSNTSMNYFSVSGHATAGHVGGRTPVNARLFIDGAPTGTTNAAYSTVTGVTSVKANLTGTTGIYQNYAGSVYGGNFNVFTQSGGTFIQQVTTQENDIALTLGASAAEKHALNLVQTSTDSLRAVYDDSALGFTAQDRWNATCTTSPLALNATGCTMAAGSGMTAGDYMINFHNTAQDIRYIACTGADPTLACTWSPGLTSATTLTGGFDLGNIAPWSIGINFGSAPHASPFYQNLTATDTNVFTGSTLIGYVNRTIGTPKTASANIGIDFSNVTFSTASLKMPGFTLDNAGALALGGVNAAYPTFTTGGAGFKVQSAVYTDTTGSGTIATEAAHAFAAPTIAATSAATTITNLANLYLATPVAGTNVTATNLWSLQTQGAAKFAVVLNASLGATIFGAATTINNNSNFNTTINAGTSTGTVAIQNGTSAAAVNIGNTTGPTTVAILGTTTINKNAAAMVTEICDGTTSGNCTIGGANKVLIGGALTSSGTTFTLGTGTGACASTGTLVGGAQAGSFLCTGTAGASTIVVNLPTTVNGWSCWASDITSGVVWAQLTPTANNSCKLTGAIATTSDKVVFGAMGY